MNLFETLGEISKPVKWWDRVRDEDPLRDLRKPVKPYEAPEVKHVHGPTFDSCEWCSVELDEMNGKLLTVKHRDWCKEAPHLQFSTEIEIHHACNECLSKPIDRDDVDNYAAYLSTYFDIKEIKNY